MDFSSVKSITIPEGKVKKIECNGVVLWKSGLLPSAYQQVEWVRGNSENGAHINLGIKFDTACRVKMGMYIDNTTPSYIFGSAENSGKYRCMISAPYGGTLVAYGYGSTGTAYVVNAASLVNGLNELELYLTKGICQISNKTNGSSNKNTDQASYTMTSDLYLFAQNYNGNARWGGARQISYFEYYDKNDALICSLIPCYRKSDGVIGMYDLIRNTFFTNVGSGYFTKGADV